MSRNCTEEIVAMYSRYPYPSPVVGRTLAYDVTNLFSLLCEGDDLVGRKVLDAGCGTGQRVVGFAKRYPEARVVGIDVTPAALDVAGELAERHGAGNVTFRRGDIMDLCLGEAFDFIISTGVVHHLPDPRRGVERLCAHLADDGVICLWLYHPFGEFHRLAARELLLTLWGADRGDLARGQRIMEQLQLALAPEQYGYGAGAAQPDSGRGRLSMNADAFMHPIVHAYRFDEALAMFGNCDVDWVAVNGINTPEAMKLVDLGQVETTARALCLWDADMFASEELRSLYRALAATDQLRVVELLAKPTGFTILAGRGGALERLPSRIAGNAIPRDALPAPCPDTVRPAPPDGERPPA